MVDKIDEAIDRALDQFRTNLKPDEALKQSQAVLNMAHAKRQLLAPTEPEEPKGKTTRKQGGSA